MDFAFITPSYAPDYERCRLLCHTLDSNCNSKFIHYLVVDQQDFSLFQSLKSSKREILTVESILPWWIFKSPFQNGWFSLKSIPLRNWIVQQLVKLSMAQVVPEDILIFVDSDVAFVKNFGLDSFVKGDLVRLFRQPGVVSADSELGKWSQISTNLLNISKVVFPNSNYLGNFIIWRRQNVLRLYQHLELVHGKNWLEVVANSWHLSEYFLYGTFVEHILKEESNHYYDSQLICHNYWQPKRMDESAIENFFFSLPEECFSVMISAKSGTELDKIIAEISS